MKTESGILLGFLCGGVVGAGSVYIFLRKKYQKQAQDEIEAVRDYYRNKPSGVVLREVGPIQKLTQNQMDQAIENLGALSEDRLQEILSKYNPTEAVTQFDPEAGAPFVISPEEFGEIEEYAKISLTYFEDGVLTDDGCDPIDEIDETVGADFMTHFGEYEDDSVFVRNPVRKCDYEILLDRRRYKDILKTKPPDF